MSDADALGGALDGRDDRERPTVGGAWSETYPAPWRRGSRIIIEDYGRGLHSVIHDDAPPLVSPLMRATVAMSSGPVIRAADGTVVCAFGVNPFGCDHLIAAAPDLLAVVERMADVPAWNTSAEMQRALAAYTLIAADARAAIAKATGA